MMYIYYFIMIMLIIMLISFLSMFFMDTDSNEISESPFECGFSPISFSRTPFSMQFFSITIVFLVFDLEIVILLPLIKSMELGMLYIMKLSLLMGVLIFGLIVEWYDGSLDWSI